MLATQPVLSVTWTVMLLPFTPVVVAVGVPLITPAELSVSPAGIVPLLAACRDRHAYSRLFLPASSLAVSGIACWWLLQRVGLIP